MLDKTYWWLSLVMLLVFVGLNILVWALRNRPKASYALAYSIAIFLFVYKVGEYAYHQCTGNNYNFPVEFSALSYFAFALCTLFVPRRYNIFGGFAAILAGGMYAMSWWVAPAGHLANGWTYWEVMAIFNHYILYLGGILVAANCRRYRWQDVWQLPLGVGVFVGYSWLIYCCTRYAAMIGKPLIVRICDASVLEAVLAPEKITAGARTIYYVCAFVLLFALMAGYVALSQWQSRRRTRRGLVGDYAAAGLAVYRIKGTE